MARKAYIKISTGSVSETITVNENGSTPFLLLDKNECNANSESGNFDVTVTSNGNWTISGMPSWVTLTPANGAESRTIRVSYQQNLNVSQRKAVITFTNNGVIQTLTIIQLGSAPLVTITPSTPQNITANGDKVQISVTSNTSWTVTSNQSWATVGTASGSNNGLTIITVTKNITTISDVAIITFTAAGTAPTTLMINRG